MPGPAQTPLPPSLSLDSVLLPVRPSLDRLHDFLQEQIEAFEPEVRPMVAYSLRNAGKRLRPMLLFFSGWNGDPQPRLPLIQAAAVVELIHLATLVHDDILDDASVRHQLPTVAQQFGPSAAVLLGDALFAHALQLAASFPTVEVCRLVSTATRRVCSGEIFQNHYRGAGPLTQAFYYRIIELKTAELFSLSCRLGAYLGASSPDFFAAADLYGRHLGTAYQMFDDVADLLGDEAKIGKTLGTDLAKGKFTLPLILYFESQPEEARPALSARLQSGDPAARADLLAALRSPAILPPVLAAFSAHLDQAAASLQPFAHLPPSPHLLALLQLVRAQMAQVA